MEIPFALGHYKGRSLNINAQECINWFSVKDYRGGKRDALIGTPGIVEFADLGIDYPIRGMHVFGDYLYAVCRQGFYQIDSSGTVSLVDDIESLSGVVKMDDNGIHMLIVDGTFGYTFDGTTLTKVSDTDFPGADTVCFIDGYFLVNKPSTGQVWASGSYDGTSWNATHYKTAEGSPDNLLAVLRGNRLLWLYGAKTSEIWYNSGSGTPPFTRIAGGFLNTGTGAKFSPAFIDNTPYWLSDERQIVRASGYVAEIVSPRALDHVFAGYSTVSDAIGYGYTLEGYSFYDLTFPTENVTWSYEISSGEFHRKALWDTNNGFMRHRGACHASFAGKQLVGDYTNGKIYELDLDTYTDDGDLIRRVNVFPRVRPKDRGRLFIPRLELELEAGTGLITGQGRTPYAMLDWSDDGGHTWGPEKWKEVGKIGEYGERTIFERLGSTIGRHFRLTVADPVKWVLVGAHMQGPFMSER